MVQMIFGENDRRRFYRYFDCWPEDEGAEEVAIRKLKELVGLINLTEYYINRLERGSQSEDDLWIYVYLCMRHKECLNRFEDASDTAAVFFRIPRTSLR